MAPPVAVDPVGDDGRLGGDAGGAVVVVGGRDHAGHLGAVGDGGRSDGRDAAVSRQRQRSATRSPRSRSSVSSTPAVARSSFDRLPHAGVDHGHGAARAPVAVVVGRDHVGAGPGLEVPADSRVAGLDPPDPVRLGEGHPRPVGQPAGGGADVGALVELDHPGPAVPASTRPSTAAAAVRRPCSPAPASNPTSTRPGTNEPAPAGMGPLTGRVAEPGGGVLRLSTAPAGAARAATGSADSRRASSSMRASEGRPGKPMGDGVLVRVEVRS